jgi:WD40 repeat protein
MESKSHAQRHRRIRWLGARHGAARVWWLLAGTMVVLALVVGGMLSTTRRLVAARTLERRIAGAHPGGVLSVSLIGDSAVLSSGIDRSAVEWQVPTGLQMNRFSGSSYRFSDAAVLSNGGIAFTPTTAGDAALWDLATGRIVRRLGAPESGVAVVAVSREGDLGATAGVDRAITVWNLSRGDTLLSITPHAGRVIALHLEPDQVFSIGDEETLCSRRIVANAAVHCVAVPSAGVTRAAFSGRANVIATGNRVGEIRLWSAEGKRIKTLEQAGEVTSLAFDGRGEWLMAGSKDGTARIWRIATDQAPAHLATPGRSVSSVTLSPDGRTAAVGMRSGEIVIWRRGRR